MVKTMLSRILSQDKKLGVSSRRRYDLPLHHNEGTGFLILLIALMSFLSTIALSFSFAINHYVSGWSSGLKHSMTIQIPVKDMRRNSNLQAIVSNTLKASPVVKSVKPLDEQDLSTLVQPWLGDVLNTFSDLTMPSLITLTLQDNINKAEALREIETALTTLAPNATIDTHEDWLSDLIRLTGALNLLLFTMIGVISLTSIVAVASATKAQIDIHRKDIELLFLMGAQDDYISGQFLRHSGVISVVGGVGGLCAAIGVLALAATLITASNQLILPDFGLGKDVLVWLILLPLLLSGIAAISAKHTVRNVLEKIK